MLEPNLFTTSNWLEVFLRLILALFFGAIVGWEREVHNKPAGLRTHMLVSLGSALIVLIPIQLGIVIEDANAFSRVIQGVLTGIGFLGGGAIIHESSESRRGNVNVKGLTTAAAIWIAAALGIIAGCGLWEMGLMGVSLTWIVLWVLKKFEA